MSDIDLHYYIKMVRNPIHPGCAKTAYTETPRLHDLDVETQRIAFQAMAYCQAAIPELTVYAGPAVMFDVPVSDEELTERYTYAGNPEDVWLYEKLSGFVLRAFETGTHPEAPAMLPEHAAPLVLACARYGNESVRSSIAAARMRDPAVRQILRDSTLRHLEQAIPGVPWAEIVANKNDTSYQARYAQNIVMYGMFVLASVQNPTESDYAGVADTGMKGIPYEPT